jgi:carbon monoxide dehydrogenase subunit G
MDRTFEIVVARPPGDVFPWLFETDKVLQWTSGLEQYEVLGELGSGTRIRQTLEVSGTRRTFEEEILSFDPPSSAASRFTLEGIAVRSSFALAPDGGGSARVARTVDAKAESFSARFLLPVVRSHLERKIEADLERLRELLS